MGFDFIVYGVGLSFVVLLMSLFFPISSFKLGSSFGVIFGDFLLIFDKEVKILLGSILGVTGIFVALLFFIFTQNIFGLFLYVFSSTSHIYFSVSLSLLFWVCVFLLFLSLNSSGLLEHLVPTGTPVYLISFMVLIELMSSFIRPLTLAVRLAANITAGHLLLMLMSSSFLVFFMYLLEFMVAFIQSYVFMTLCVLYLEEALSMISSWYFKWAIFSFLFVSC